MKTKIYIFALIFFSIYNILYTQTFQTICRNGLNITIPDLSSVNDTISVNVSYNNVLDVNLKIDTLIHSWVSDLSIYLRKGNIGVNVFNNTGGSGDNFIGTLLDDSASTIIDSASAPFTGRFRPHNALSNFNGNNANGFWILSITDIAAGDVGTLKAWCLIIKFGYIDGGIQTVEIPNTYRLYQNYPNPFNPVTKIKYGLPKNGYMKLTVYDELGKEVDVIDEGYKQANTYEAVFDATNLPSGVYYYKLEVRQAGSSSDGFIDTKKMVIVK